MCHTVLQHYIPCDHTDVSFIPCNDYKWYPTHRTDGLSIEWRDHSQRRGVAHSYDRKCPECLKAERIQGSGGGGNGRNREAVDAWQRFAEGVPAEPQTHESDFLSTGDEDRGGSHRGAHVDDQSRHGRPDVGVTHGEVIIDGRRVATRRWPPGWSRSITPSSVRSNSPWNTEERTYRASASRVLDQQTSLIQLCEDRLAESIPWFPGLEDSSFEEVNRLLESMLNPRMGAILRLSLRPSAETVANPRRDHISTEILMSIVRDTDRDGPPTWRSVRLEMRRRLREVSMRGSRRYNDWIALAWFTFFLHQNRTVYFEIRNRGEWDATAVEPDPREVTELALNRYKDIVRHGSLDLILPIIFEAIGIDPDDITADELRFMMNSTRAVGNDINLDEPNDGVARSSPSTGRLDQVGQVLAETHRVPETIVASVSESVDGAPMRASSGDNTSLGSQVARPALTRTSLSLRSGCNAPTHAGIDAKALSLKDLLGSQYHGDCLVPHTDEVIANATDEHSLLVGFSGCAHYNAISVAGLKLCPKGGVIADCGCRGFPPPLLKAQRAFSLGRCLICRWSLASRSHLFQNEEFIRWTDLCHQRQVRAVKTRREIELWPFGANSS